ncbi:fertility inhibition protein [Escherichia coli]|nr:fertility inhibition protein [Escherichia coli]
MKAGACRYDTEGYVTEHISQEEEVYAAERLDKIRRQNRIKAELQACLMNNKKASFTLKEAEK